jgi:protein Tex
MVSAEQGVTAKIFQQLAGEIKIQISQVRAAVDLLDGGATVPFIARYRKEVTNGLDDVQLRELEARLAYLRELEDRRAAVLKSIEEQGKLTDELRLQISEAATKQELEDIYLPYKPKRRTKGMIAREAGLEPLADALLANLALVPLVEAEKYLRKAGDPEGSDFSTPQAVLEGVRDLLSERWAEDPALVQTLRQWLWEEGVLVSKRVESKPETDPEVAKFRDYFDFSEPINRVPSHRALAVFRGRSQDMLEVKLVQPVEPEPGKPSLAEGRIAVHLGWSHQARPSDDLLRKCVAWAWRAKLSMSLERDLFARLREEAEKVAIKVFADNVRDLLLAAPAGARVVMGLDPGIRTGVKVAVVDATGKVVDTATVYPHEPRRDWEGSLHTLERLCAKHGVNLIAIGNGTASRETDQLAADLLKRLISIAGDAARSIQKVVVSESGASVYSASEYASQELPELDVSLRGAVSIARRLQDPLAELVKIDPKSIGVGQYQHDVSQSDLAKSLDAVVEDCVNAVGVELNTASVPLLTRISGLTGTTAKAIVRWRESQGAFCNRRQLLEVSGLGPKTFEQCAGFLRIRGGDNPLDMTGVHPESYEVVEKIVAAAQKPVNELMGQSATLKAFKPQQFASERFGVPTVSDILVELDKPGRDPRGEFVVARFNEGLNDIKDLTEGMILQGTISNVAAFGAFVDLGVHQDGLIHVSQLSHKFVNDAREVVRVGQTVKVRVMEVDIARKRIGLSLKLDAAPVKRDSTSTDRRQSGPGAVRPNGQNRTHDNRPGSTAMSEAFAKLKSIQR